MPGPKAGKHSLATTIPLALGLSLLLFGFGCQCESDAGPGNPIDPNGEWQCPTDYCECNYPDEEECYSGPEGTRNVGICRAGTRTCTEEGTWGPCWGQVLPMDEEICDGKDSTCNGIVDEGCPCNDGETRTCYGGPSGTLGVGECKGGTQHCINGAWGDCEGQVMPKTEQCNGRDNSCDGTIDTGCDVDCSFLPNDLVENCPSDPTIDRRCCCVVDPLSCQSCGLRYNQPCYTGRAGTGGNGPCVGGLRDCIDGVWTECQGQVLPAEEEICGDGIDNTCSGLIDDGCPPEDWCVPGEEKCDGMDNLCNGRPRETCDCVLGEVAPCYLGSPETRGVGACSDGTQECIAVGDSAVWGSCKGSITPKPERCDNIDHSCDGMATPPGCCMSDPDCMDPITGRETCCNGQDSNCNGIVDDGLVNACGLCPGHHCWIEEFPDPDPIEGGWDCLNCDLDGVGPGDPSNPESLCGANQLCLDRSKHDQPFIWVARTGENRVQRINTSTFETDRYIPSYTRQEPDDMSCASSNNPCYGWSPSRTAVAADGSVWVGFRGCKNNLSDCGNSHLPEYGNATRIDTDGSIICRADVTSNLNNGIAVRAIALDQNDHAWIGSWSAGKMYQYSGSQVDNSHPDGVPRCVMLQEVDLVWNNERSQAYGAAVNSKGELWIATMGWGPVLKIDTNSGQVIDAIHVPIDSYGIAIDREDNVWLGNWSGTGGLIRIDGQTNAVTHVPGPPRHACEHAITRGVAIDFDGNIWAANWDCRNDNHHVSKYAPNGDLLGVFPVDGNPLGMAVANDGRIWSINFGNSTATVLETDGTKVNTQNKLTALGTPYTYSDMTGLQHRLVTRQQGTWINTWDSGWLGGSQWLRLTWMASEMPLNTEVCVRVRAADTLSALASANTTGEICSSNIQGNIDLRGSLRGQTPRGRYIQVQVRLLGSGDLSPVVDNVEVYWERP